MTQQREGAAANFSPESQNLKALVCFASKQEDGKKIQIFQRCEINGNKNTLAQLV